MSKTYAIADLHGRFDLLEMALARIAERAEPPATLVTLGDYVDRGPDSRKIIECLMAGLGRDGWRLICLKGNHEDIMWQTCRRLPDVDWWLTNGGVATLISYGQREGDQADVTVVPASHLDWIERLPLMHVDMHRVFVHAGVNPNRSLDDQDAEDLIWKIYPDNDDGGHGQRHVVHGHHHHADGPIFKKNVVVGAASGAVGSVVGQIARIKGARAVGIAGGPDKCSYMTEELGFDACIDHRTPDLAARLATACPKGIDVYFENGGGAIFEAVFPLLNPFARIPVCGLISMYNATSLSSGPILIPHLMRAILTKRLTFRGFIVSDFFGRYGDFTHDVSTWVGEGRIKYREDVVEGLKNAPRALIGLLRGENFGKLLVRVAHPSS